MTILEADIKLLASKVMDDVPNGGGGPTGTVITYGQSNGVFDDATEADRAGGNVSIRQVHASVRTANVDSLLGANIILAQPPTDDNVSVTLAKCGLFARRTAIASAIASYLIQASEWSGYLLENHVAGQRVIQMFHRPGTPPPPIGRTLVLAYNEGLPGELLQYVRVIRATTETRTFTYSTGGGFVDFEGSVTQLDLSDALRTAFPGSPPDRAFARSGNKTIIRDTTVADAAVYYGASAITAVGALGQNMLKVASVYSQLVPSSRTETPALDQRPAAARAIVLAEAPRRIEVGVAAHTQRIKIGQENRSFNYVFLLKPLPSPNSIAISWRALGNWYELIDDGAGGFTGSGVGQIVYATGSVSITLPSLPDAGSAVIIQWGETTGYNNRSSQGAAIRPPEYAWLIDDAGAGVPGSYTFTWYSGGVLRTATDNGTGGITGAGAGAVDYPSNTAVLRPSFMPDPGADINVAYTLDTKVVEVLTPGTPDAFGVIPFTLASQPQAGSLALSWITVRNVSNTSGGTVTESSAHKASDVQWTVTTVPEYYTPPATPPPAPGGGGTPLISYGRVEAYGP